MSSPAYGFAFNGTIYPCDYPWDTQNIEPTQNRLAELNLQDHIFIPQDSGQMSGIQRKDMAPTNVGDIMNFWKILFCKIEGVCYDYFEKLSSLQPNEKVRAFSEWCIANQEKLKTICTLELQGQGLTTLPKEIGFLTGLELLNLEKNKLTALPEEIGCLKKLVMLHIDYNAGIQLPASMSSLEELQILSLMENKLKEIPASICCLPKLKILNLRNNFIEVIPPQIEGLKSLEMLDLDDNDIKGLPSEIHKLSSLECLYLESNKIEMLPHEMCDMPKLNQLKLQNNRLEGNDATVMNLRDKKVDVYL